MDIQYYNQEMLGKLNRYLTKFSIFLIMAALIAGMVGCGPVYNLTISSTAGGSVTDPGEGTFTYEGGTVVPLVAEADEDYLFVNWTGDVSTIADVNAPSTNITVYDSYSITANFYNPEIRDWYDLDDVRDNLAGNYTLMNDLDSTTAGYTELASPTANEGKGWQPIGTDDDPFTGVFDGQGYEIRNLFINSPDEGDVGLFGYVEQSGGIENIGVTNATVIGKNLVGSLVGYNFGIVSNSHSSSSVTGNSFHVGGLVGGNEGIVTNSCSTGIVTGGGYVGGLVGTNVGTVSNSHSSSSVTGSIYDYYVGGLVGINGLSGPATVTNSYSTGSVTGESYVGGLVGGNMAGSTVSNSYSTGNVIGNLSVGGLVGGNEGGTVTDSYSTGNVTGVDNVGGLVGENLDDGDVSKSHSTGSVTGERFVGGLVGYNFYTVSNSYSTGSVAGNLGVGGLVGANEGLMSKCCATGNVSGNSSVGGLAGLNGFEVSDSYATGNVTGYSDVGGLVGGNDGDVSNSYSAGSVTGDGNVGGLVGTSSDDQYVSNSFWDTETSGQATSDGGTGKNTTEMQDITTFSGATWDIIAVALNETNPEYLWNIVDDETYPFLSWQP